MTQGLISDETRLALIGARAHKATFYLWLAWIGATVIGGRRSVLADWIFGALAAGLIVTQYVLLRLRALSGAKGARR